MSKARETTRGTPAIAGDNNNNNKKQQSQQPHNNKNYSINLTCTQKLYADCEIGPLGYREYDGLQTNTAAT